MNNVNEIIPYHIIMCCIYIHNIILHITIQDLNLICKQKNCFITKLKNFQAHLVITLS